jgi:hypothetical protein
MKLLFLSCIPFAFRICLVFFATRIRKHTVGGLRCKEKIHEDLLTASEALYTYQKIPEYFHISNKVQDTMISPFHSGSHLISREALEEYLKHKGFLS